MARRARRNTAKYRANGTFKPNLPTWMRPHFRFLLPKAETRESFFERIQEIFPPTDDRYKLIERAYDVAERDFEDRPLRDTGEKYFNHLRATALILIVYLRVRDANVIAAALLHDIVEDLPVVWNFRRLAMEFNEEIATIVFWVTKPAQSARLKTKEDVDAKFHRNLNEAPRSAVIVKLADRLHNLITLWRQKPERMERKVRETRDFFLGLAEKHIILIHELEAVLAIIIKRHGF